MKRIRRDELNGETRFFGVRIITHEHWHTREHNRLVVEEFAVSFEPMKRRL